MKNIISRFCDFYLKHYKASAAVLLVIFVFFGFLASRLKINSNQLDLLPQGLPEVIEAKKVTEMVGGTGFFMITIKNHEILEGDKLTEQAVHAKIDGDDALSDSLYKKALASYAPHQDKIIKDAVKLKEASDILYNELSKKPNVRFIQYKINLDFIKNKFLYFWKTDDLNEAFRRIGIKRDELVRKSDPFYIQLVDTEYNLELADLVNKYTRIGKKEIIDDYYVSPDRRMMIMLVRPRFSMNDIEKSRLFLRDIQGIVKKMDFESRGLDIGYTGTYVQYVDAYDSINDSLKPTLFLSLFGITLILYFFIRRKRLIVALLISLIFSIVVTFGLTYIIIGQLNIITATFGGILAGFGIDFGLHYIYRFREEFWESGDIYISIKNAIFHTGKAAISSASTTAAAFIILMTSSFKGFSEFGIISTYGIIITALSMFFVTSLQIVFFYKHSDKFKEYLSMAPDEKDEEAPYRKINYKKLSSVIIYTTMFLFVVSLFFINRVQFDPDSRHMLEKDIPSEVLKTEMQLRYDLAGDPLAIATDTLEEAASLFEYFEPMNAEMKESIGQIMSMFSFVPPQEIQKQNYRLIQDFKNKNQIVKYSLIPDEYKSHWQQYQTIINQQPFTYKELPPFLTEQFLNVPESNTKGYLTYIYPNVDKLFFTYDIDKFYNLTHEIHYPVVGKRTLRTFAGFIPQWEKLKNKKMPGNTEKSDYTGLMLSEKEKNGILDIANNITEAELAGFGFFPLVNNEILHSRPFSKFEDIQKTKKVAKTTGSIIVLSKFTHIVKEESRWIIIGTSILVIIILLVSFRNIVSSTIALIPLVAGMIIIMGVMVISGIQINYFNVVIFPIIIGYGINNGIFIYHRFLENNSVSKTLSQTGSAVIASSLTTLAGWGTLLIAVHPGLRSMGVVAVLGLTIMLIISLTFLPAVIFLTAKFNIQRNKI